MKRLLVTYHFIKKGEACESAFEIDVRDEWADRYVQGDFDKNTIAWKIMSEVVHDLAYLSGAISSSTPPPEIVDVRYAEIAST